MARFFVPPLSDHSPSSERVYRELRDHAEACTGAVSRERRIERVECRRSGHDCMLRVGEPDAVDGRTVAAIIQVGRGTYTVHHVGVSAEDQPDPLVLRQSEVYSVTEFQ